MTRKHKESEREREREGETDGPTREYTERVNRERRASERRPSFTPSLSLPIKQTRRHQHSGGQNTHLRTHTHARGRGS